MLHARCYAHTRAQVMAGAYIIPPLVYLAASRLVVRPLLGWAKVRVRGRIKACVGARGPVAAARLGACNNRVTCV